MGQSILVVIVIRLNSNLYQGLFDHLQRRCLLLKLFNFILQYSYLVLQQAIFLSYCIFIYLELFNFNLEFFNLARCFRQAQEFRQDFLSFSIHRIDKNSNLDRFLCGRITRKLFPLLNFDNSVPDFLKKTFFVQHMVESLLELLQTVNILLLLCNYGIFDLQLNIEDLSILVEFMVLLENLGFE
jgi:hypothetical protein